MKLSANEEYGLRCLVRIGYAGEGGSLTIPEMSAAEGVSPAYAAKILRVLRKAGFVKAARGKDGGYTLARPAEAIVIGDVMDVRAYWVNGGPIWFDGDKSRYGQKVGDTVLEKQLNNWYHYIWLCGDHICEQHVHNIDVANWIMNYHPVKCWGMGARQQLGNKAGEIWDNFGVEFQYANGVRLHSYCGQIKRAWSSVSEAAQGSKGSVELHDGRNYIKTKDGKVWKPGEIKEDNGYVNEHRDLICAILNDTPLNEAKQVADSTLTALMGREAAYSGSEVDWETMLNSTFHYGPEMLYQDCSKMAWGDFRTLAPPMPGNHNIFKENADLPLAKA